MTSTTHPADALPLPEPFMAMCRDTVPHIYDAWANQIRAARREGYELAMSKRADESALRSALNAMLTQFGMDEDEWNKPTFDQAREALAERKDHKRCEMCGFIGEEDPVVGCPRCGWDEMKALASQPAQEQSVEDKAQALIDAGHAFWKSCKPLGGGAVRWLQCEDGTLIIFTRGEYRERLMSCVSADYSAPQYVYRSGEWQALSATPLQQRAGWRDA